MKNKDPHKRLTELINRLGYEVTYQIEEKIGPYTVATARLFRATDVDSLSVAPDIIGYGISRRSRIDEERPEIGNQVAVGRAMTAAVYKIVDPDDEEGPLSQISPLMA